MDWFYAESGKQIGPIDEATFERLAGSGIIRSDTLVWHAGMPSWQPYLSVRPASQRVAEAAQPGMRFCSECGRPHAPEDLITFGSSLVCADCKPAFTQKLREGVRPRGTVRYGGFWIRFLASFVDGLLLGVILTVIAGVAMAVVKLDVTELSRTPPDLMKLLAFEGLVWGGSFLCGATYETTMVGRFGATLGKMACGLKVVRSDGSRVTYARSLGRHFAKTLSSFALCIGYLIAAFDDEKRALHDRICDTRVVKT